MGCGSSSGQNIQGQAAPTDANDGKSGTSSSTWSSSFFENLLAVYGPRTGQHTNPDGRLNDEPSDAYLQQQAERKESMEESHGPEGNVLARDVVIVSEPENYTVDASGCYDDDDEQEIRDFVDGHDQVNGGDKRSPVLTTTGRSLHLMADVVDALTRDLHDDVAKARVLFRWLGENVQYVDTSPGDTIPGDDTATAALGRRVADADGFSKAYAYLCNLAAIECHPVYGLCKAPRYCYYPGYPIDPVNPRHVRCAHAWNTVELNGSWYLCDVTWAAGFMVGRAAREWDDDWFMANPKSLLATHLPYDNIYGVRRSQQLVADPIRRLEQWNGAPVLYPAAFKYDLRLITHASGIITTKQSSVSVILSVKNPQELKNVKCSALLKDLVGTREYGQNWTMAYVVKSKIQVEVRLPSKGNYLVTISAASLREDTLLEVETLPLITYKIENESSSSAVPFPVGTGHDWGTLPLCKAAGIDIRSPQAPISHTKDGKAVIRVRLPTDEPLPNGHRLHHHSASWQKLAAFVYPERIGKRGIYHIQCPFPGEYRFEVLADAPNSGLTVAAAFLIVCNDPVLEPAPYGTCFEFAGLRRSFRHTFALSTKTSSSTFRLTPQMDDSVCHLQITKSKPVRVSAKLVSMSARLNGNQLLIMSVESDVKVIELWPHVSFLITAPSKGNHLLELFASESGDKETEELIGVFSVQST